MTTLSKALVPIDDSEASLRALRHAMRTADEIHIVNVQHKADTPALLMHMTQQDIDHFQAERGRSTVERARQVLDDAKRRYQAHLLIGEPAPAIVRVAREQGVDVIVMGSAGHSPLAEALLGSTSLKVVHLAEVPVTLVK
jgi:nucleotide-binding universal stress UspA family protein